MQGGSIPLPRTNQMIESEIVCDRCSIGKIKLVSGVGFVLGYKVPDDFEILRCDHCRTFLLDGNAIDTIAEIEKAESK